MLARCSSNPRCYPEETFRVEKHTQPDAARTVLRRALEIAPASAWTTQLLEQAGV
ncbi:hypothetical protein [Gemmatimonas sp.]|uniref:hypothetical protein n=1 Tax=Gemmatimonas sp. TaxID=1962908 RepID=UPI0033411CC2